MLSFHSYPSATHIFFPCPHLDVGHPVGESGSPPLVLVLLTLAWKKLCSLFQGQGEVHSYWTSVPRGSW